MNAKIHEALSCYGAIENLKLRLEKMERHLHVYVNTFSEKEMGEYIEACERIDHKLEKRR